jgi:hypothetical protein
MLGLSTVVAAWTLGAALHTPPLARPVDARDDAAVPRLRLERFGAAPAIAQPTAPPAAPGPAAETTGGGEACDVDCETAREDARLARLIMRNRARTLRAHRAVAIAAWSSMLVAEVLGTVQAVNQPTWFGDGACTGSPEAFGCHQSSLITGLHETFAITTTALYTTAAILAVAAPDPDDAAVGDATAPRTLRLHKAMAWVHGVGMVLLPLMGIVTAHPQILGLSQEAQGDFGRAMRTVHTVVGYSTFAALTFSAWLEL